MTIYHKPEIFPRVRRLIHYLDDLKKGLIQVPAFQRDFVWNIQDKLDLFDSIKKSYPIGSLLFWKPQEADFGTKVEIGPFNIPASKDLHNVLYILDGYQRLSSIFGCLINPEKLPKEIGLNEEKWRKEYQIYYDLKKEEFFPPRSLNSVEAFQVPIYQIMDTRAAYEFERSLFEKNYPEEQIRLWMDRYARLGTSFIDYELPCVDIIGSNIEEAVEIFSRVNSKGSDISPDWIVSALTYNKDKGFRLGSLIDELLEELKCYNFDTLQRNIIFNCIIHSFGKAYFDQSDRIESLAKQDNFIETTKKTLGSIKKAARFLFEEVLVIHSRLLPYKAQFIFITDFFNKIENPSQEQLQELKRWFWVTTYSNYFTIYSISKQRSAYKVFQSFLRGECSDSIYNDKPDTAFDAADFPTRILFGSVRSTALVLFLMNYSNDFKACSSEEINGFSINYIFHDAKNEDGHNKPEAVIPIIEYSYSEDNEITRKQKDLRQLLEDYKANYEKTYLISPQQQALYADGKYEELIELRKVEIMQKEKELVESLGKLENSEKALINYNLDLIFPTFII